MKEEMETYTYSNQEAKPLTIEDIKKCCDLIFKQKEKSLPKRLSWFTRLMAKFGWHREYELLVMDKSKMSPGLYFPKDLSPTSKNY